MISERLLLVLQLAPLDPMCHSHLLRIHTCHRSLQGQRDCGRPAVHIQLTIRCCLTRLGCDPTAGGGVRGPGPDLANGTPAGGGPGRPLLRGRPHLRATAAGAVTGQPGHLPPQPGHEARRPLPPPPATCCSCRLGRMCITAHTMPMPRSKRPGPAVHPLRTSRFQMERSAAPCV